MQYFRPYEAAIYIQDILECLSFVNLLYIETVCIPITRNERFYPHFLNLIMVGIYSVI
jgi:hypothetical protein